MANFNFQSFIAEYPDAKHLTLKLIPGSKLTDDLIERCYSNTLGRLILTIHKKTVIHAYFSDMAWAKNQKEVRNE